jgi:hypothetical protein
MKKQNIIIFILFFIFLSACTTFFNDDSSGKQIDPYDHVENVQIIELICAEKTDCINSICPDPNKCLLTIALSEGCNTTVFPPKKGVGKCVEYEVLDSEVRFWVSENCNFRYSQPEEVQISVFIDSQEWRINHINPDIEYIKDPTFCRTDRDCRCLSGSGLPLIGSSNYFYAPLNPTGFFEGEECGCKKGRCEEIDGQDG